MFPVGSDAKPLSVTAEGVPLSEVVALIYKEILRSPYVLAPEVYADRRLVAVRIVAQEETAFADARRYLRALGLEIVDQDGVDRILYLEDRPQAYVYRPRHRDVAYLQTAIRPILAGGGTLASQAPVQAPPGGEIDPASAPPGSAAAQIDQRSDTIVVYGLPSQLATIRAVLLRLDVPTPQVEIKATVYEVTSTKSDGGALKLAGNLLRTKLGVSVDYAPVGQGGGSFSIKGADYGALAGALSTDLGFNTVSSPVVRAKSGSQTEFTSGEQVPVLGAVSYAGTAGQPVQSVEYKDSGVIFRVRPDIHKTSIDLLIEQEISSFTTTNTGVNNSPTLIKRAMKSNLTLQDGEVVLMGGLTQRKRGDSLRGILGIPLEFGNDDGDIDVVIMLQATVVRATSGSDARPVHVRALRPQTRVAPASAGPPAACEDGPDVDGVTPPGGLRRRPFSVRLRPRCRPGSISLITK